MSNMSDQTMIIKQHEQKLPNCFHAIFIFSKLVKFVIL